MTVSLFSSTAPPLFIIFLSPCLLLLEFPFLPVLRTPSRSTNCLHLFLSVRFFLSFRLATVRQSLFRTSLIASWAAGELPATIIAPLSAIRCSHRVYVYSSAKWMRRGVKEIETTIREDRVRVASLAFLIEIMRHEMTKWFQCLYIVFGNFCDSYFFLFYCWVYDHFC